VLDRTLVLPHTIAALAAERPDSLAMVDVAGRSRSWADLHGTCLRWAAAYRSLGVGVGDTVVTMLPNSFEAFDVWLGAAWLRAVEVPANNMYRGEMLRYLIEDSQAAVLVIAARYLDRLAAVADQLQALRTVVVVGSEVELPELPFQVVRAEELLDVEPLTDAPGPQGHDIAALIYTSGTTGPSKGVLAPWAELHQSVAIMPEDLLAPGDPYYTVYPAFHLSGKCALYTAAVFASHLVVREVFSVTEFWNDLRDHKIRACGLLGPMAMILMSLPPREDDADNPLEKVVMGPIIPAVEAFKERFGVSMVSTGFGMTEIGFPLASGWNPPNHRTCGRRREGSPGYELRIVDEHDHPVPIGEVGELIVRSAEPWVMNAGYWRQPERTAAAWRNGWFHTGDGFREDEDGWLYFVDRTKDALRRRGENISSFEVEAGIAAHPAVAEVAVVGVPSELGEDEVKAVIVPRPDAELDPAELIEFLVPRMPRFMIPRYVELVDALPKTDGTFRVQKFLLRERGVTAQTWDREAAGIVLPH
jgi:crotonobetaine/carnitine-CoA ligase